MFQVETINFCEHKCFFFWMKIDGVENEAMTKLKIISGQNSTVKLLSLDAAGTCLDKVFEMRRLLPQQCNKRERKKTRSMATIIIFTDDGTAFNTTENSYTITIISFALCITDRKSIPNLQQYRDGSQGRSPNKTVSRVSLLL
jgi:hypothetical protein